MRRSLRNADTILEKAYLKPNGRVKSEDFPKLSDLRLIAALKELQKYGRTIPDNINSRYEIFNINDKGRAFFENGGFREANKIRKERNIRLICEIFGGIVSIIGVITFIINYILK